MRKTAFALAALFLIAFFAYPAFAGTPITTWLNTVGDCVYTTPSGTAYLKIWLRGGGGGGAGSGDTVATQTDGGPGDLTWFKGPQAYVANGAVGGSVAPDGGEGGHGGAGDRVFKGAGGHAGFWGIQDGGYVAGMPGAGSGGGRGHYNTDGEPGADGGGGASGGGLNAPNTLNYIGSSGGQGAKVEAQINSPLSSYNCHIGAGGTGGDAGHNGFKGGNGGDGWGKIEAYPN